MWVIIGRSAKKMNNLTPKEFIRYLEEVLQFGVQKGYTPDGWKEGDRFNPRDNHASMSRHLAEAYCGKKMDQESGLHPLKHLATRALMQVWYEEQNEVIQRKIKSFE